MIRALDLSDEQEVFELMHLQREAYAVEADLIGSRDIPGLRDTLRTLQRCGETFFGCFPRGELVGAIPFKREVSVLDIHRLVVRPDHFRRGIARALVAHAEANAENAARVVVSTGTGNLPATRLYRSLGFEEVAEVEAAPEIGRAHV